MAVFTAASLIVLVSAAALAVDTGHATYRKRVLQGTADLIALDAVRAVGDRYDPTLDVQTRAENFAQESAFRNGFDHTVDPNAMTLELGVLDWNTNTFTTPPPGGPDAANAVRVVLSSGVSHGFLPGSTSFDAEAIAGIDAQTGIQIGSSLTRFESSDSTLDPILEDMIGVSLDAASYDSLLAADVALGDLWLQLGLGSPDEVLNATVSVADAFQAMIHVLDTYGDAASVAAATALGSAAASVDSEASFTFEDVLSIATGSTNEAAGARVSLLWLVAAAASAANGSNLIDVDLPVSVPGVSSVRMRTGVIEVSKIAIGPARTDADGAWVTKATTAQMRMQLDLVLSQTLSIAGQQLAVRLPVYLQVGGAAAEVTGIDCLIPFDSSPIDVHVTTSASSGYVGSVNDASLTGGTVTVAPGVVVEAPLLTATATATTSVAGSEHDLTFTGPFDRPPAPETRPMQTVGTGAAALDELASDLSVTVTPAPGMSLLVNASLVATQLRALLEPVIESLDSTIVDALTSTPLGFFFGGADVTNLSLNCHIRRLAG